MVGSCGCGNEPSGCVKGREFCGMTISFLRTSMPYAGQGTVSTNVGTGGCESVYMSFPCLKRE